MDSHLPGFRLNSEPSQLIGWKNKFQMSEHKRYPKKTVIVEQGERVRSLFFIVKGLVEYTYMREDGTLELLEILGDGNLFGLQPIFGNNPAVGSFIALEECVLSLIHADRLNDYIEQEPGLAKELLVEWSRVTGGLIRQICESTLSADSRVEELIYLLAEYSIKKNVVQCNICIPLSHDDLARMTRTTRVTVTKAVRELKNKKLIDTCYGGIIVKDLLGFGDHIRRSKIDDSQFLY